MSEESRKRLSETKKGKILTEEHRKKMSESHKGKKQSDETRMKISETLKGRIGGIPCKKQSQQARNKTV